MRGGFFIRVFQAIVKIKNNNKASGSCQFELMIFIFNYLAALSPIHDRHTPMKFLYPSLLYKKILLWYYAFVLSSHSLQWSPRL